MPMQLSRSYHDTPHVMRTLLDSEFVPTNKFFRLLLCRRKMVRSDNSAGSVRGLLDQQTGRRYLIEDKVLRQWRPAQRRV
jgi:hypothetical protein